VEFHEIVLHVIVVITVGLSFYLEPSQDLEFYPSESLITPGIVAKQEAAHQTDEVTQHC
jgi:Na+/citrate or Na+/malate symporter